MAGTKVTYKDCLKDKVDDMKGVKNQKRDLQDRINAISEDIAYIEDKKNSLKKSMHRDYTNAKAIESALAEMQKRYETTSLSNQEEKKII